jgi:membrane protease YdiL (CAAX protease family)
MAAGYWFAAALIPAIVSQIIRLLQKDPGWWLFFDYAGRVGALAVLAAIPAARRVAFQTRPNRLGRLETILWIFGLVLCDRIIGVIIRRSLDHSFLAARLGSYPRLDGTLYLFDLVCGLALVALSEEILFRRCAHHVLKEWLGQGYAVIAASALLFAAYHWWTGVGNIAAAFVFGAIAMAFYRRSQAFWPLVIAHDITDVLAFR